jgi:hypothetical protein
MRSAISPPAAGNIARGAEAILSCIAHLRRAFALLKLFPLVLPMEKSQTRKNHVAGVLKLAATDSSAEDIVQVGGGKNAAGLISGHPATFHDEQRLSNIVHIEVPLHWPWLTTKAHRGSG